MEKGGLILPCHIDKNAPPPPEDAKMLKWLKAKGFVFQNRRCM